MDQASVSSLNHVICIQSCKQFCKTRFECAIPIYSSHTFQQITISQISKHKSRRRHGHAENHWFVWTHLVFFQDGFNLHKVGVPKQNVQKFQLQLFGTYRELPYLHIKQGHVNKISSSTPTNIRVYLKNFSKVEEDILSSPTFSHLPEVAHIN